MATGLGGLAQGLAQGLQSGISIGKAVLDKDRYELERPELELKADMSRRKLAANEQFKQEYADWEKTNMFDPDGNPLPDDQKPNELVRRAAFFNLSAKAHIDNNAWDPEQVAKMSEYGRQIKKDGVLEAMQMFMRTGDSDAALKVYNSVGDGRAPPGTQLRSFQDEAGMTDVGIYTPDGKMLGTLNQVLFATSADNVASLYKEMTKTKFQERQANTRTGISAGATIQAATLNNAGAMDRTIVDNANRLAVAQITRENKGIKDPVFDQIKELVVDYEGRYAQNPVMAGDPQAAQMRTYETAALAEQLLKTGKASSAMSAVVLARKQLGYDKMPAGIANPPKK
jgi:hypothetical protein